MSHTDAPPPPPPPSASTRPGQPHDPDYLHNPETAHEHTDVNVRTLVGLAITLFVVVVMVSLLMGGLFKVFEGQAAKNDPVLSPLARPSVQMPASQVRE